MALALASGRSVGTDLAILSLAVTIGLAIGAIRIRRLRLGISGVLFSALLFGQFGFTIDPNVLQFLRDFALILFMYSIGLQVGPGFGSSLRAEGIRLNALSAAAMVLGALMTVLLAWLIPKPMLSGLYAGAFNTTPGLAAAQEALHGMRNGSGQTAVAQTALAYSITYPFGVVGPMLVVVMLRAMFRVRLEDEKSAFARAEETSRPHFETMDIEVTTAEHAGKRLRDHPLLRDNQVLFSRILRGDVMSVPTAETVIEVGDVYRAVGSHHHLIELVSAIGRTTTLDPTKVHGDVSRLDLVVTRTGALHRSLRELDLTRRAGVTIARVNRAGVELTPTASLRLAFADQVTAVGPKAGLKLVEAEVGNCQDRLNQSQLTPIFLGIVLGVVMGSIPLKIPGLSGALRMGLSGGSFLAAIALSRLGSVGPMVWYVPAAANQLFRDFGLAIFLACVGFEAGDHFVQRAAENSGLMLVIYGAVITVLPVLIVGVFARVIMKMNFVTLSGWVAGAMGSETTLLFAQEMTSSNAPAVAFAAVLPVAELLPIICCQALAIIAVHGH